MASRYPVTIHISQEMAERIDTPVDAAVISNRPGGGNTTQSFLKGDIIADQLNAVFGPLGWSVEARIHQMDDWDEQKTVTRNNQPTTINQHIVQVVSDVKLTVKKTTADGTDTVFVQPGIGYGEVDEGKARKEAFGMAVKGAATDGLKRCASLLGKAFGMMMASNGKQEDIEYAHNGKAQNLRRAQDMRRQVARDEGDRGGAKARGNDRQREDRQQEGRQQEDRQRGGGQDARRNGDDARDRDRARQDADGGQGEARGRQEDARREEPRDGQRRPEGDAARGGTAPQDGSQAQDRGTEKDVGDAKPAAAETAAKGGAATKTGGKRQPDTSYSLDSLPITKDDMTDFGATLVERVREMRQNSDRVGLVRQHLNTVKNLDAAIRRRVIERLRELDVDVDKIPS